MITFLGSILALILGYFIYGKVVEKIFGIKENRGTPAMTNADGVDYVPMNEKKAFLIQFLNIAGTGPIFGAIAGALWGPAAFMWIVFGCIFGGAVHDFLIGMMSLRSNGGSVSELVGENLGKFPKKFMVGFSVLLLLLVGVVFIKSPADILANLTGFNPLIFIGIIIVYYLLATIMPVDKIIGKIYPIFGIALLVMAVGIAGGLIFGGYSIPEFTFANLHPKGMSIFPYLFISIACGAISGFHATQSPMMARCMRNERDGRKVFYGAMITEGVVALIWAAAAMTFFGGTDGLLAAGSAPVVVNTISNTLLGPVGGILAILGVVACPITSGDTAFRSIRLTIADTFKISQKLIMNRFVIAIPLFVIAVALCFIDFNVIWRYFSWANQTLAAVALWTAGAYLKKRGKNQWIAVLPAIFMTIVTMTYIVIAPEGFVGFFKDVPVATIETIGLSVGITITLIATALYFKYIPSNVIGEEE